jgi:hypothetical protein
MGGPAAGSAHEILELRRLDTAQPPGQFPRKPAGILGQHVGRKPKRSKAQADFLQSLGVPE